jgi:hypothetical protein
LRFDAGGKPDEAAFIQLRRQHLAAWKRIADFPPLCVEPLAGAAEGAEP